MKLNHIYHSDCLEFMKRLPDESIDLIVTDPPNFEDDGDDRGIYDRINLDYFSWLTKVIAELSRILKVGGELYYFWPPGKLKELRKILKTYFPRGVILEGDLFHCVKRFDTEFYGATGYMRIRNLIAKASTFGDLVFDPFMGEGTTALAAESLHRNFLGCEINKKRFEEYERHRKE
jgi:site-specific DNA-methyltransferase (adenine-specific)